MSTTIQSKQMPSQQNTTTATPASREGADAQGVDQAASGDRRIASADGAQGWPPGMIFPDGFVPQDRIPGYRVERGDPNIAALAGSIGHPGIEAKFVRMFSQTPVSYQAANDFIGAIVRETTNHQGPTAQQRAALNQLVKEPKLKAQMSEGAIRRLEEWTEPVEPSKIPRRVSVRSWIKSLTQDRPLDTLEIAVRERGYPSIKDRE